jgi:hypothetical protein
VQEILLYVSLSLNLEDLNLKERRGVDLTIGLENHKDMLGTGTFIACECSRAEPVFRQAVGIYPLPPSPIYRHYVSSLTSRSEHYFCRKSI